MSLFLEEERGMLPLAERARPKSLEGYFGQKHLLGEGKPIAQYLSRGKIPSMILWGGPGTGKTTLALLCATILKKPFRALSAIQAGVKEVREVIEAGMRQPGMILFLDEIHRFNKSQQDALLGAVEKGIITLIGATTENPSFEVNRALLSRCQVYVLEPLTPEDLLEMLTYVSKNDIVLKERIIHFSELEALYSLSGGDARKALNLLELAVLQTAGTVELTDALIIDIAQKNVAVYDKGGEMHYDIISAFIKSIRGSDPQAALYWLARMLEGGEQPDFIARRMLILAAEDIGNANPNALLLAETCYRSVEKIGMPESRIILSQVVIYLACSVKSNTAYTAIESALQTVRTKQPFPVPLHLRNAPTELMKTLGFGKAYKYSHQFEGKEGNQDFLPPELKGTVFYHPSDKGREIEFKVFLKNQWGETYKV